jgi:hypothetical protein
MQSFLGRFVADPKPELELYRDTLPLFEKFDIESHIDANLGKKVWLKSGGYLIVDQSEALTAIDVNTGRYVGKQNLEETVLKTNLEAVKEVVNQLRFRNIGGLIIIDLIDMETAENREKVYRALQDALREDKAKTNILKISELGLVEMTRKRTRENLVQQLCEPCGYCDGRGYLMSPESVAYKVLREVRKDLPRFCGRQIAITVNPDVADTLQGSARKAVTALRELLGREIEIRARHGQHQEQFEVTALDEGPPVALDIDWLKERREKSGAASRGEPKPEDPERDEDEPQAAVDEPAGAVPAGLAAAAAAAGLEGDEAAPGADDDAGPPLLLVSETREAGVPDPAGADEPKEPSDPEGNEDRAHAEAVAAPPPAAPGAVAEPGSDPPMLDEGEESPILRRSQQLEES